MMHKNESYHRPLNKNCRSFAPDFANLRLGFLWEVIEGRLLNLLKISLKVASFLLGEQRFSF